MKTWRRRSVPCLVLLLLLSLCACVQQQEDTPEEDAAVAFYDRMLFQWRDPAEAERMRQGLQYCRDDRGRLLFLSQAVPDGPARLYDYSRPETLTEDPDPWFLAEITAIEGKTVCYTLRCGAAAPAEPTLSATIDVRIDNRWYFIWNSVETPGGALSEDGVLQGTVTADNGLWGLLLPGHYRLCLSDDPAEGWVVAEFDLTEAEVVAWAEP